MKLMSRFLVVLAATALGCVLLFGISAASGPGKSTGDPDDGNGYRGQGFRAAPIVVPRAEGFRWSFWHWRLFVKGSLQPRRPRGQAQ